MYVHSQFQAWDCEYHAITAHDEGVNFFTEANYMLDLTPANDPVPGHFTSLRLEIVCYILTRAAEMLLASARTSAGRLPEVLDTRT